MRLITSGPFYGLPSHRARCILSDPPWRYQIYSKDPGDRAPDYDTMTIDQIMELPVNDLCAEDCWLFLWTSGPFLDFARQAMRAWGFKFSTIAFTWVKLRRGFDQGNALSPNYIKADCDFHRGLGKTTRKNCEIVLLGKLGSPRINQGAADELVIAPVREHSRKPDCVHDRIEALCAGPRVELFARSKRHNWTCWGNQIDLFPSTGGEDGNEGDQAQATQ